MSIGKIYIWFFVVVALMAAVTFIGFDIDPLSDEEREWCLNRTTCEDDECCAEAIGKN